MHRNRKQQIAAAVLGLGLLVLAAAPVMSSQAGGRVGAPVEPFLWSGARALSAER